MANKKHAVHRLPLLGRAGFQVHRPQGPSHGGSAHPPALPDRRFTIWRL